MTRPTATPARSTSTSGTCARSSSATRAPPSTCSRCAASAIASATRDELNSVRNRLAAALLRDHRGGSRVHLPLRRAAASLEPDRREAAAARAGGRRRRAAGWPVRCGAGRRRASSAAWCAASPSGPTRASRCSGFALAPSGPQPEFVVGDSEFERTAILSDYPVAATAAASGRVDSAVEQVAGARMGETAVPLLVRGRPRWVAVLSTPLGDVDDNVALIRRQILIAGVIALAAALAAGWLAARAHAKRLRRLEAAAEKVAEGDFSTPIPDEGTDEVGQLASTLQRDAAAARPARQRAQGVHRQRLARAADADLLARRASSSCSTRRSRTPRRGPSSCGRCASRSPRLTKLDRRPAGPLEARRRRARVQRRARSTWATLARRVAAEFGPAAERHGPPIERRRRRCRSGPGRRRSGGADHAYPARQCAHAHAGGNLDRRSSARAPGRRREPGRLAMTAPASTRTRARGSSTASTRATA